MSFFVEGVGRMPRRRAATWGIGLDIGIFVGLSACQIVMNIWNEKSASMQVATASMILKVHMSKVTAVVKTA